MDVSTLEKIKIEVRENMAPYFSDEDIQYYFEKNNGDFNKTVYELLLIKSEDSTVSLPGYYTGDTSKYFKMLASRYRTYNTGVLSDA